MIKGQILACTLAAIGSLASLATAGDEDAVLEVKGRGVEGRPAYDGGGVVKFLDVSIGPQVIHYQLDQPLELPLRVRYDVLEPAPVLLTSRMGTEYWRLYSFDAETMAAMYTDERIDLGQAGQHTAVSSRAWFGTSYGAAPPVGLVGIRGHYYFLIDKPNGKWIDVTDPPAVFDSAHVGRKLTFTLANLSRFELAISQLQSTWEPGGPFRVRLVVTDSNGRKLPVVNAPLIAAADDWSAELATEWGPLDEPTGWIRGSLPDRVPDTVTVSGTVTLQTPAGLQSPTVTTTARRGDGYVSRREFMATERGYRLPRNKDGLVRETRAVWVSTRDIATAASIDGVVQRAKRAGLNMIVPDIFVRNTFMAKTHLLPMSGQAEEGLDPLAYLIERAHELGLEVHPWFCVTYRDGAFRHWFLQEHKTAIDMIDRDGAVISLGADAHRPEYRDFMVELMVGVARDYQVDGIHLDYIRSMGQCFCKDCRREFAGRFHKPLTEATEEQWIQRQRSAIGDMVARTAQGVRQARPGAIMSAAVFSNMQGGAAQGQDPAGWARLGWLDLVIPMDYRMQTLEVRANERQFLEALDDENKLVTGLSLYMRSGRDVLSRPPDLVREQIQLIRRMDIRGYCLFAFNHLSDGQLELLSDELNREPAVPYFR